MIANLASLFNVAYCTCCYPPSLCCVVSGSATGSVPSAFVSRPPTNASDSAFKMSSSHQSNPAQMQPYQNFQKTEQRNANLSTADNTLQTHRGGHKIFRNPNSFAHEENSSQAYDFPITTSPKRFTRNPQHLYGPLDGNKGGSHFRNSIPNASTYSGPSLNQRRPELLRNSVDHPGVPDNSPTRSYMSRPSVSRGGGEGGLRDRGGYNPQSNKGRGMYSEKHVARKASGYVQQEHRSSQQYKSSFDNQRVRVGSQQTDAAPKNPQCDEDISHKSKALSEGPNASSSELSPKSAVCSPPSGLSRSTPESSRERCVPNKLDPRQADESNGIQTKPFVAFGVSMMVLQIFVCSFKCCFQHLTLPN
jgi:hypothetical protein